ncbi:MAG TPA: amidohydrolase family protein [Burkholderiales bacterium]|jgi:predicted amidohydrolase YtcJ
MQVRFRGVALTAAVLCLATSAAHGAKDDDCEGNESLRLVNGRIHTMDAKDSVVHEVLIRNGRFAGVGRDGLSNGDGCTRTINLRGRTAVPGIIDNHDHIVLLGLRPGHDTRIENARSIAEVLGTLAYRTKEVPAGDWITALGGFNISQFTPPPAAPRMPTLAELDTVTPKHPVLIMQGFNGPTATNSLGRAFFEAKGITVNADGAIPSGGQSVRALNALRGLQTFEEQKRGLGFAMTYAAQVGVTTHLDQGGFPNAGQPNSDNAVDALANFDRYRAYDSLRALYQQGKLTNRIWVNFLHMESDPDTPELRARLLNVFNNYGDDLLRIVGIGEFTAGGLFPGGDAWLNGTRLVAQARWRNENHSLGFNVAPGVPDWKFIIDSWQQVHDELSGMPGTEDGIKNLRWVLAHAPFMDNEYLARLKNLGGGISLVGGWRYISGTAAGNGPPFRLIVDSGIPSGMSSDGMQISPMNPWLGMYYAVTGRNARGDLINGGQQITRKEVLRLYTADNGWFLNAEDRIGTIEAGRFADLIVLSDDYFDARKVSDEAIKDVYSVLTVVNGKVVHDDLDGRKRMYWHRDTRRRAGLD